MQKMKIGVMGYDVLASDLAFLISSKKFSVVLIDDSRNLKESISHINQLTEYLTKKYDIKDLYNIVFSNLETAERLDRLDPTIDIIIELRTINTINKLELLKKLENYLSEETIIASNIYLKSINELAEKLIYRDRFIGINILYSPLYHSSIELIKSKYTSERTIKMLQKIFSLLDKSVYIVDNGVYGSASARVIGSMIYEAIKILNNEISYLDIDSALIDRLGFRRGIFELIDLIGLNKVKYILNEYDLNDADKHLELLDKYISSGNLGIESGSGFYKYPRGFYKRVRIPKSKKLYDVDILRILSVGINVGSIFIRDGIIDVEDLDNMISDIIGFDFGLFKYSDYIGLDKVVRKLNNLYRLYDAGYYKPNNYLINFINRDIIGILSGSGFYKWSFSRKRYGYIEFYKLGGIGLIKMIRLNKLNALDEEMWRGLYYAFKEADDDNDIKVVILTGDEDIFSAGDDIKVMSKWNKLEDAERFFLNYPSKLINKILDLSKPLIIGVNGLAYGGGMELILLGDIVISVDNAEFSIPEVLIGAYPPIASSYGIYKYGRRLIKYALTGDRIRAEEAKEIGFVDIVIDRNRFWDIIIEEALKILKASPLGVKSVKKLSNKVKRFYGKILAEAIKELINLSMTKDFHEGMNAFINRKKPRWRGM